MGRNAMMKVAADRDMDHVRHGYWRWCASEPEQMSPVGNLVALPRHRDKRCQSRSRCRCTEAEPNRIGDSREEPEGREWRWSLAQISAKNAEQTQRGAEYLPAGYWSRLSRCVEGRVEGPLRGARESGRWAVKRACGGAYCPEACIK